MKMLIVGIVAVASSTACLAADLPSRQAPQAILPVTVPLFVWSGPYIGANVGYISGQDHYNYRVAPEGNPVLVGASTRHGDGVLGGGQIGYNFAFNNIVIGPEADFEGSTQRSVGLIDSLVPTGTNVTFSSRLDYLGTVRGRLGYAFDRVLVYGTGGFAYAHIQTNGAAPEIEMTTSASGTHTGYAVGGGVEFALTRNLLLRGEYLHVSLGNRTVAQTSDENLAYQFMHRPVYDIGRIGLSYLFVAPVSAPVVARY